MCWELTVVGQNACKVLFQFTDIPREIKRNRGHYYGHSLGYEINSCSRPEIVLVDRQIFVWGETKSRDYDVLDLSKESFINIVRVLSGFAKVKIKGVDKFCIGGC